MLRQKRIINSSLYYCKKSLTSERSFHLTYSSLLRRLPSSSKRTYEIKPVPEEPNVAGSFVAQPLKNTFNNFYGIESDEGVIHINTNSSSSKPPHDSFIDKFTSKKLPEKFVKTSFGKIRFDRENKVILHGQFEEGLYTSEELSTTRNIQQVPISRIQGSISSNSVDVIQQPETPAEISKFDVDRNQNHKEATNVSFIDELYFPEKLLKEPEFDKDQNQKLSFEVDKDHNLKLSSEIDKAEFKNVQEAKNVSFIDESYFPEKLLQDRNVNSAPIKNSLSDSNDSNFIENYYFGQEMQSGNVEKPEIVENKDGPFELYNETHKNSSSFEKSEYEFTHNMRLNSKQSLEAEESMPFTPQMNFSPDFKNIGSQIKKDSLLSKEKDMSFIDECFFKNNAESNSVDNSSEHFNERIISPKTLSNQDYSRDQEIHQNNQIKPDKELNYSSEFVESFKPNTIKTTKTMNLSKLSKNVEETSTASQRTKSTTKFAFKEAFKKSIDSNRPQERNSSQSLFKNNENVKKVNEESTPKQAKSVRGDAKNQSEDQNVQDEEPPETAYDYVKKLRGEQKTTYHESLSGFKTVPEEKLDSKGFRVLKNQVPQLKYYTRDEMLELLVKNVLYSDDDVVVLNKPYNLVMHESKTTKDACLSSYLDDFAGLLDKNTKNPKLLTVHRLDKETTGCLLLARNEISARRLNSLFAQRKITKTYWIVTIRVPDPLQGIIDIPISEGYIEKKARMVLHPNLPKDVAYRNHSKRGKNAVTHYNVISESGSAALVEVKPETGIKHQIRVHFGLGLGCPILGDHKYSYADKFVPQKLSGDLLHRLQVQQSKVRHIPMHIYARSIFIPQYTTGRNLFVVAPMPIHMSKNLQRLKFKKN